MQSVQKTLESGICWDWALVGALPDWWLTLKVGVVWGYFGRVFLQFELENLCDFLVNTLHSRENNAEKPSIEFLPDDVDYVFCTPHNHAVAYCLPPHAKFRLTLPIFLYNHIYFTYCTYIYLFFCIFPYKSFFMFFFVFFYICMLRIRALSLLKTSWLLFLGTYQKKTALCLLGFFWHWSMPSTLDCCFAVTFFLPPNNVDIAIVQCFAGQRWAPVYNNVDL